MRTHKKMLFICSKKPFPVQDGGAIRTMQMYKMLHQHFQIDLLYSCDNISECVNVNNEIPEDVTYLGFYLPKWKSILQAILGLVSNKPLQCAYFFNGNMNKYIKENINQYDYVFCNNIRTASYLKNCARTFRYIDFVDAISMNYSGAAEKHSFPYNLIYKLESKRLSKYESEICRNFNKKIIISEVDANYIKSHSNSASCEISVIPNSVHIPVETVIQNDNYNITFVGSMFYEPNILAVTTFAKKVFPLILEKFPAAKFYIVGSRPAKKVKNLASDNIVITGFVEDPKIYIKNTSVVIAPMYSGAGVQNKILEALSLGACVVTTKIGSEGLEGIKDGEEIIIEDDFNCMANKINALLSDKSKRKMLGTNAKKYVSNNFSFDKIMNRFNIELFGH